MEARTAQARVRPLKAAGDSERRVRRMVERHGRTLLRVAQQLSLCPDDALDAYQRALEIYLRRLDSLDPATELAWLKVVVRHEALAVRRSRRDSVAADEPDLDAHPAGEQRPIDDRIASGERAQRSAEVLRHLKADEARALMLKAEGYSYQEIGEQLGWTYTKVNRSITEGRARFMKVFGRIEAGEECERFAPVLQAMVAGAADHGQLMEIRPHLRHCARCRATIRRLHLTRRERAAALIPLPVLGSLRWVGEKLGSGRGEELQHRLDGSTSAAREAAAAAEQVAPAADQAERLGRLHPLQLKQDLYAFFHRLQASDVATGVQIAGTGGGGRGTAIAALLGFCFSSLGAGAYCVATGVLPDPVGIVREDDRGKAKKPAKPRVQTRLASLPDPAEKATIVRVVDKKKPSRPRRRTSSTGRRQTRSRSTSTSHEQPPVSPAPPGSTGKDFTFEQSGPAGNPAPAAAPPSGGGEFQP